MQALAHRALTALAMAMVLVLLTYTVSYRRHRALLMEGAPAPRKNRRWVAAVFDWLIPDPRRQAVIVFLARTLGGSSQHRTILMGYGGFGLAIFLSGTIGMRDMVEPARVVAADFVYAHTILLVFLLIGVRHLFSIPVELKANWAFQITEREGRREWLRAVDRFVLVPGALAMLILPFPLEVHLPGLARGWRVGSVRSVRHALLRNGLLHLGEAALHLLAPAGEDAGVAPDAVFARSTRRAPHGQLAAAGMLVPSGAVRGCAHGAAGHLGASPRGPRRRLGRPAVKVRGIARPRNPRAEPSQVRRGGSPDRSRGSGGPGFCGPAT